MGTSINLRGCKGATDKGVCALAATCTALTSINLERYHDVYDEDCASVTDEGLYALAASCTALTYINLTGCDVTSTGTSALAASCTDLEIEFECDDEEW